MNCPLFWPPPLLLLLLNPESTPPCCNSHFRRIRKNKLLHSEHLHWLPEWFCGENALVRHQLILNSLFHPSQCALSVCTVYDTLYITCKIVDPDITALRSPQGHLLPSNGFVNLLRSRMQGRIRFGEYHSSTYQHNSALNAKKKEGRGTKTHTQQSNMCRALNPTSRDKQPWPAEQQPHGSSVTRFVQFVTSRNHLEGATGHNQLPYWMTASPPSPRGTGRKVTNPELAPQAFGLVGEERSEANFPGSDLLCEI